MLAHPLGVKNLGNGQDPGNSSLFIGGYVTGCIPLTRRPIIGLTISY